jgi:hypothetical protein
LKVHIHDFAVLINGSPQVKLLAVDLHEDFIDIEGIAITSVISLQATNIDGTELYAPEPNRLMADSDAPLGQEILDIAVAKIEAIVEPDSV